MSEKYEIIYNIIEIIKRSLEEDERVKICYKWMGDKGLQIQLKNGETFNLSLAKMNRSDFIIKRPKLQEFD